MERLSGLDASFLYLETQSQVLHICALITLDPSTMPGGYDFAVLHERLATRVEALPAFRRKLRNPMPNVGHPLWVDDDEFDLDRHVHRIAVPAPGGRDELAQLCAHIAGQPLDRRRPLWEMYVIEGLADGSVVLLVKMHHASVDGVSGANLVARLADLSPEEEAAAAPQRRATVAEPGWWRLAGGSIGWLTRRPMAIAKLLPDLVATVPKWVGRSLTGKGMPVPFTAPRTLFNATITGHRSVAYTRLELDTVKRVKNAFGVTVNDIVLALCAGALREYLLGRGDLPDDPLVATVPVSVQERTARMQGNNKVSALFAMLPTHLADPVARVFSLAESNRLAKDHHSAFDADMLQDWAQLSGPALFGLGVRAYSALRLAEKHPVVHNLVISNVPGPPMPLYLFGAKVTGFYPLGPVFHGAGLNMTVLSYAGHVDIGLIGARELASDLWALADAMPRALDELRAAAETDFGSAAQP